MPMRGELSTTAARSYVRPSPARTGWFRFVTAVLNPELQTGVAFCMIGILLTLIVSLLFPDFGVLIAELNSFQ
jgi:hypothetical protein